VYLSEHTAIIGIRNQGSGYSNSVWFRGIEFGFSDANL